jgi:hypothetical protein
MTAPNTNRHLGIRLAAVLAFAAAAFGGLLFPQLGAAGFGPETVATPTPKKRRTKPAAAATPTPQPPQDMRFADFKHQIHIDMEIACSQCHKVPTANWDKVRPKESAFPDVTDFPKHESCLDCHREQFFSGRPPAICRSCHANPSPSDSTRYPFPNPRELFDTTPRGKAAESEFQVAFPHDKHIEIVSRVPRRFETNTTGVRFIRAAMKAGPEDSCKVCHRTQNEQGNSEDEYFSKPPKDIGDAFWLKKGTFKSSPIGHASCFTCHSADTGIAPAPTDCGKCHKVREQLPAGDFDAALATRIGVTERVMLDAWKSRVSSGTFRHEWFSHAELGCATCHNVAAMKTNEAKTKKISATSCIPCHVTGSTADGGVLNAEIDARKSDPKFSCVKCHLTYGRQPVPESHLKAIVEAGK